MSTVTEELKEIKKRLEKQTAHFKELQKEHAELQEEERANKLALAAAKRTAEEMKIRAEASERAKVEIDIQYRHVTEVNKEQTGENRELQNKVADLEGKLEDIANNKASFDKQKDADLAEITKQRQHLESQQKFADRKLEDDRQKLQTQFQQSKHELRRNFNKELENHRQAWDIQMNEVKREHKLQLQAVSQKLGLRVETLERDNQHLQRKLMAAQEQAEDDRRKIAILERDLRREKLNTEVAGTSLIEEVAASQQTPGEKKEAQTLERKLAHSRLTITEQGDEVLSLKRQKVAADRQIKVLRREIEEADLKYQKLETVKNDIERRLTKRIEQLESQLQRRNQQLEAEAVTARKQAEAIVDDKSDEVRSMSKRVENSLAEAKDAKTISAKLSQKLATKLDDEMARYSELEREKLQAITEARHAQKELGVLQENHSKTEKELTRVKHLYESSQKELTKLQSKNAKLEQGVRRLEARV
jgi:chromosome segregation ATPase